MIWFLLLMLAGGVKRGGPVLHFTGHSQQQSHTITVSHTHFSVRFPPEQMWWWTEGVWHTKITPEVTQNSNPVRFTYPLKVLCWNIVLTDWSSCVSERRHQPIRRQHDWPQETRRGGGPIFWDCRRNHGSRKLLSWRWVTSCARRPPVCDKCLQTAAAWALMIDAPHLHLKNKSSLITNFPVTIHNPEERRWCFSGVWSCALRHWRDF